LQQAEGGAKRTEETRQSFQLLLNSAHILENTRLTDLIDPFLKIYHAEDNRTDALKDFDLIVQALRKSDPYNVTQSLNEITQVFIKLLRQEGPENTDKAQLAFEYLFPVV